MGYKEIFAQYSRLARTITVTDNDLDNYHALIRNGGFSRHPRLHNSPRSGYMISHSSHKGGVNHQFDLSELSPEKLAEHRVAMEEKGLTNDPNVYQGGWIHGNRVYLDVSHNVHDEEEAVRQGQHHDQKAIYHIDSGREIPTGGSGLS